MRMNPIFTQFKKKGSSYIQFKSSNLSESLKSVFQKKAIPIEMNLNAMRLFKFLLEKSNEYIFSTKT